MGVGFFSRRKQHDKAIEREPEVPSGGAEPIGQPPEPVGEMVQGAGAAGFDISSLMGPGAGANDLGAMFSMIGKAMQTGQAQVHINQGGEQVIDLSNTADVEQIHQALAQAGIDVNIEQLQAGDVDAGAWREQIMQNMRDAGFDPETMQGDFELPGDAGGEPGSQT